MQKIEIKSLFTDWHEVSKKRAKEYVKFLLENITTKEGKELIEYIETNKLKGVKVNELLGGKIKNERV